MTVPPREETHEDGATTGVNNAMITQADSVIQAATINTVHLHRHVDGTLPTPRQLPCHTSHFVGRTPEIDHLNSVLNDHKHNSVDNDPDPCTVVISAISGTAGVGKTTLALHWAHRVREQFPDGDLYINLRGFDPSEPPLTPSAALENFLQALNIPADQIPRDTDAVASLFRSALHGRKMLILLDNAATADQVRPLIPGTNTCLVLITSRNWLPGLTAHAGASRLTLDLLPMPEAVALLRQIIGAERADAEPNTLPELARLCARLPLALSIVAERIVSSHLPLAALVDELSDRHKRLDAFDMDPNGEPNAIVAVFSWSYQALAPDVARLFRLLAVHPGPEFSIAAVAALVGTTATATQKMLETLIRASLIDQPTNGRYRLHDLLRSYAIDRANLDESGDELQEARHRVLLWYLYSSDAAESVIDPGYRRLPLERTDLAITPAAFADTRQAMDWYSSERFNLIAATNDAAANSFPDLAWKIAAATSRFYYHRQHFDDWLETHRVGLDAARQIGERYGEAELLNSQGIAYVRLRQIPRALEFHRRALEIRQQIGDRHGEGVSLNNLGFPYQYSGRLNEAYDCFNAALTIARELNDKTREAVSIINLSMVCLRLERSHEAHERALESLVLADELESADLKSSAHDLIGESLHKLGHPVQAIKYHTLALESARKHLRPSYEQGSLHRLGCVYRTLGQPERAVAYHRQALSMSRESGNRSNEGEYLDDLAEALRDSNNLAEAKQCWREALAIFDGLNPVAAAKIQAKIDEVAGSDHPNDLQQTD